MDRRIGPSGTMDRRIGPSLHVMTASRSSLDLTGTPVLRFTPRCGSVIICQQQQAMLTSLAAGIIPQKQYTSYILGT